MRLLTSIICIALIAAPAASAQEICTGTGYSHGPITGGIQPTLASVWIRAEEGRTLSIAYSSNDWSSYLSTDNLTSDVANDYTLEWELSELKPNTYYDYLIIDGLDCLTEGHFTTAPINTVNADFKFVVFSDSSKDNPGYSYESATLDDPKFALIIGDYDHTNPGSDGRTDIDNWRLMHREMLSDSVFGIYFDSYIALNMPIYWTWDDHDYGDNNEDKFMPGKRNAKKAFNEYHILKNRPSPDNGIWHKIRYAQVEIFMLDTRYQRDANGSVDDLNKSMLDGNVLADTDNQKVWLKERLLNSTATWKIIVSSSPWNITGKQVDSWYKFQTEREELIDYINLNNISGVVFITGDLHSPGLLDDGTNSTFYEMSVPPVNITGPEYSDCTGPNGCGIWSVPWSEPSDGDNSGYGLVEITYDEGTLMHQMKLIIKDNDGTERRSLDINLQ